ncbi:hypothetical protein N7493_000187 [Penicillium malachiteum]|uniref:Zn(2)-C6 fungal-type domain-containing protein n=1 Tax=Penicillium malachiteum TaxID=1324776 RepID=A0AAD6HW07_9EURO|nr:hypothetical protein N7493_000187 [Penicillium malachiteum]
MPPDSKTKIRPQQSCLKCRERKVKCDRSIPCHACIIRGLEAECTYLTTPEDREHISQAEIIDRLRREVAQLRTQLSHGPKPNSKPKPYPQRASSADRNASRNRGPYARPSGYDRGTSQAPGFVGVESTATTWSGSSPGSTETMTNSAMTVNSPESTGSGASGSGTASVFPGSTGPFGMQMGDAATGTAAAFIGANFMDDATLAACHGGIPAFMPADTVPTSIPLQNINPHPVDASEMNNTHLYRDGSPHSYTMHDGGSLNAHYIHPMHIPDFIQMRIAPEMACNGYKQSQIYPQNLQWGPGQEVVPTHPYANSYYSSSSMDAFAHTNVDPNANIHHLQQGHTQSPPTQIPHQDNQPPGFHIPSSWKVDGKQELLETLLETISSCDEARVAQVIQVVRTSATPEDAVSGICQVLGISANGR